MNRFTSLLTGAVCGVGLCAAPAALANPTDTIQMRLSDGASMTLYVRNAAELRKLRAYKMDSLMALLDRYITQAENVSRNAGSAGKTTMEFNPQRDLNNPNAPEKLRVVVYGDQQRFSATDGSGRRSRNGRSGDDVTVRVGGKDTPWMGVHVEDGPNETTNVKVGSKIQVHVEEGKGGDKTYVRVGSMEFTNDSLHRAEVEADHIRHDERRTHTAFHIGVGLNTLLNADRAQVAGQPEQTVPIDLRPGWASRFVQLGWLNDTRIGNAVTSAPFLRYGLTFVFNNYMLDKNRVWVDDDNVTRLADAPEGRKLQKSKLATSVLNIPMLLGLKTRNKKGDEVFHIAAGGFVGYLLNAHTKLKYQDDGSTHKPKQHGSFNLQDVQYGVSGAVAVYGHEFFVNYNLNELFRKDRGPQANVLAFGYSFSGIDGDFKSHKYRNQ